MYSWLTGVLSGFLDNVGRAAAGLIHNLARNLARAVFMDANTYATNPPNLMVKSIAEQHNVRMPSFFGYMLWSAGFLLPLFGLLIILFFVRF
jgi:Na+/H+ antiporter NhaD/arsenite permease-like protein